MSADTATGAARAEARPQITVPDALRPADPLAPSAAAELARQHGLDHLGGRPRLVPYLVDLWQRRSFVVALATGQSKGRYQDNRLGVLWTVLNPLLLVLAYYIVFGLLLGTRGGVDNFVAFLSVGIIVFGVQAHVISAGSKAIRGNLGLVRTLRFPRAVLPISVAVTEFVYNIPAIAVLLLLMLALGETPTAAWLLLPVALALFALTMTGISLLAARLVDSARDLANLVPLVLRLLRYVSGVFFSVSHYAAKAPEGVAVVLEYQPFALFITLVRQSLMGEFPVQPTMWLAGSGWAVAVLALGLVVFWRGEGTYGRG